MLLLAQSSSYDPSGAAIAAMMAGGVIYALVVLAFVAFSIFCYALIAKKAGYNPWLALLMLVPVVNFVLGLIFVFSEWPIIRENRNLRGGGGGMPPGAMYGGGTLPPVGGPGPMTPV